MAPQPQPTPRALSAEWSASGHGSTNFVGLVLRSCQTFDRRGSTSRARWSNRGKMLFALYGLLRIAAAMLDKPARCQHGHTVWSCRTYYRPRHRRR